MHFGRALLSIACTLLISGCSLLPPREPEAIPLSTVVAEVESALHKVELLNNSIKWKSAELTLETIAKDGKTGSIEFWVVSAEASITRTSTQTISYKLVPNPAAAGWKGTKTLSDELCDAIVRADADIRAALPKGSSLTSDQSSVSLKFAVETSKTAGGKVELTPVKLGGKTSRGKTAAHTIKITF